MKVPLSSRTFVRELLEFLDVIESTDLTAMPEQWRDRQSRTIDYHQVGTEHCGYFFYYDAFRRQKIDETTVRARSAATWVIPDHLDCGWVYVEEEIARTPRDDKRHYHLVYWWRHSQLHAWVRAAGAHIAMVADGVAADQSTVAPLSADVALTDDFMVICCFLEDVVVLSRDEAPI